MTLTKDHKIGISLGGIGGALSLFASWLAWAQTHVQVAPGQACVTGLPSWATSDLAEGLTFVGSLAVALGVIRLLFTPNAKAAAAIVFFVGVSTVLTACAQLAVVGQDVGKIADIVIADVMAGKPFAVVLRDTGTEDAQLLVDILDAIVSDPGLTQGQRDTYAKACAPYLVPAVSMAANQKAAGYRHLPEAR